MTVSTAWPDSQPTDCMCTRSHASASHNAGCWSSRSSNNNEPILKRVRIGRSDLLGHVFLDQNDLGQVI